jgi:hypothetical protein
VLGQAIEIMLDISKALYADEAYVEISTGKYPMISHGQMRNKLTH